METLEDLLEMLQTLEDDELKQPIRIDDPNDFHAHEEAELEMEIDAEGQVYFELM